MSLVIPPPSSEAATNVMKANKAKNTKPEIMMRDALRAEGLTGYRISYKGAPGRPDIAFVGKRIAIQVLGCYWHRCPKCNLPMPKSNIEYWKEKFKRNKERDERKRKELGDRGWKLFELWECDVKRDSSALAKQIVGYIGSVTRK